MQIRVQGKKIQCIRSSYDPAIKRSRQTVVLAFDRWSLRLPPDAELAALTEDERQELAEWFQEQQESRADRSRAYTLSRLGANVAQLTAAVVAAADGELSAEQAAEAWAELARLQKALKAAGFPRPKREKPAQVAAKIEGQGELL